MSRYTVTLGVGARRVLFLAMGALGASSAVSACGSSREDSSVTPSGGTGGNGVNDGSAGTGGAIIGSGGSSSGGTGGDISPDAACATGQVEGKLQPVSLMIMLDTSGSMIENFSQKWANAQSGIRDFVSAPSAAGLKAALAYFPDAWLPPPDRGESTCDGGAYALDKVASPNMVAMGTLPGNRDAIVSSLTFKLTTNRGTPTEDALNGIRLYCSEYVARNPGERCVGVLVTDGEPNGCNDSPNVLADIAAATFKGNPSVPLYVIGMDGANFTILNQIAARGGGTPQAFNVNDGGSNAFLNALDTIRGQVMACDFALPAGSNVDPARINIDLTTKASVKRLGKVANAAACVPNAWYYDKEPNPTRINLCPASCATARADSTSRIDIVLGCTSNSVSPD